MHTLLYLIRHGETEGTQSNCYKGHIDVPLSGKGIKQMERVAKFIQNLMQDTGYKIQDKKNHASCIVNHISASNLSAVYSSDLSRAVKSAEIIAEPHSIKPVVVKALRERNFGIWEGMSFDEIKEKYPEDLKAWASNPLKFSPLQGESTAEVRDRVIEALNKILSKHSLLNISATSCQLSTVNCQPWTNIAIVSHSGINRIILCHLLEIPLENMFRIEQDFGALNIIEFYDNYPVVKLINYIVQTV